jgi:RNA polymerase sigma-70 factor (ECF subfamily)
VAGQNDKQDVYDRVVAQNEEHFRFIAQQYASASEVPDLYQEILYHIWKNLDQFDGRSAPETWAWRIAMNTAITYRRNSYRRNKAWRAYGQNVPSEQKGGRSEEQMLNEFVESLPDMERSLFAMYLSNLSYQEIAESAGISGINLRVRISRLRKQFEQRYL